MMRWKNILALSVLLTSGIAHVSAQSPQLTGIAHIALRAVDLDGERAFFQKLGLEEAFVFSKESITTQVFVKINDRQFIELYPRLKEQDEPGWMHT